MYHFIHTFFNIKVSGYMINGLISFKKIVESLSWPELWFAFTLLINFHGILLYQFKVKEHKILSFKCISYVCLGAV